MKSVTVLLGILFQLLAVTLSAQNGSLKGRVIDSQTKEPLVGVGIILSGTTHGVSTDLEGYYKISNIKPGNYTLISKYVSYNTFEEKNIKIQPGKEIFVNIEMESSDLKLSEVVIVAKVNRESENVLLLEQKQAIIPTQAIGAKEMSRKGIDNAESALKQLAGIAKQEGVKNVFVRGLGDRYNISTLNGFPIPSEDPEYKNISLDFFGSDIIQQINVKKVFSGTNYGDVGGAAIDIGSKELNQDSELHVSIGGGNNSLIGNGTFMKTDGVNFMGVANSTQPNKMSYKTFYNFANSLDPRPLSNPLNNSLSVSGGKRYEFSNQRTLSFNVVANYSSTYSLTKEKILDINTAGDTRASSNGEKSSQNINQLLLGNLEYKYNAKNRLGYNFMLIHDNNQYVGTYKGYDEAFVSSVQEQEYEFKGITMRQQTNENLLMVHQLRWLQELNKKLSVVGGIAYNWVKGVEPDRKVNKLFQKNNSEFQLLAGDGAHIRNFTELVENDINGRLNFAYKLPTKFEGDKSLLNVGYNGRFINDRFNANEYSMIVTTLLGISSANNLRFDNWFNQNNLNNNSFVNVARFSNYKVNKYINAAYIDLNYQLSPAFTLSGGIRKEIVLLNIDYHVEGGYNGDGTQRIWPSYWLPSIIGKYNLNAQNTIRFGVSKSYTLPQSKEISPYQYIGLSFNSQGNPKLIPSENYNADIKWDTYLSGSEIISLSGFYKNIKNPIARAYEMNGAGYYTYKNISDFASVAGVEIEARKNIFNKQDSHNDKQDKISIGLNGSYIYSSMYVQIKGTLPKHTALEGAAPYIANIDISYVHTFKQFSVSSALVCNYVSDKIFSIGAGGFENIIEKGISRMDFITDVQMNKHLNIKLKANNLLDPSYELTRKVGDKGEKKILNSHKKGVNFSLGLTYNF